MEASNEFRRREPTLPAIFAAKRPAAIEFRCGDAAMTGKSYQPSREFGECRFMQHASKRRNIADREDAARGLVQSKVRRGPHRIRKDDGPAASERLVGNETPGFAPVRG